MDITGTPSASFLPASEYKFESVTGLVSLTLPIRGVYQEGPLAGNSYDICPKPGVFLFGTMSEVLFSFKIYPELTARQLFVISGVDLSEEDNELTIFGRVATFVEEKNE